MPQFITLPLLLGLTLLIVGLSKGGKVLFYRFRAENFALYCGAALLFILTTYISLVLHECGHYIADLTLGLDNIKMKIGLFGGEVTWGSSHSRILKPTEFQFTTLAGFAAMRIVAILANLSRRPQESRSLTRTFLALLYLVNRTAIISGWQQSLFKQNDFSASARAAGAWTSTSESLVLFLYGAIIAIDIYAGRKIIRQNAESILANLKLIK